MERADDSAGQIDDGGEQHRSRCRSNRQQLQPREQERDHDRGEYFKEAFNPQVNYPPAPVFRGDQRAALAVHQAGSVEQRDRDARDQEQHQQRMILVASRQRRLDAAPHQPQPEDQPDEQEDLPDAAQVNVFVTLRSQPEPHIAELLLNAHPFAGKRADDDHDDCDEQNVHAKALSLRFGAADRGTMYRPVASQEVAIQKMPICKCQVRAME